MSKRAIMPLRTGGVGPNDKGLLSQRVYHGVSNEPVVQSRIYVHAPKEWVSGGGVYDPLTKAPRVRSQILDAAAQYRIASRAGWSYMGNGSSTVEESEFRSSTVEDPRLKSSTVEESHPWYSLQNPTVANTGLNVPNPWPAGYGRENNPSIIGMAPVAQARPIHMHPDRLQKAGGPHELKFIPGQSAPSGAISVHGGIPVVKVGDKWERIPKHGTYGGKYGTESAAPSIQQQVAAQMYGVQLDSKRGQQEGTEVGTEAVDAAQNIRNQSLQQKAAQLVHTQSFQDSLKDAQRRGVPIDKMLSDRYGPNMAQALQQQLSSSSAAMQRVSNVPGWQAGQHSLSAVSKFNAPTNQGSEGKDTQKSLGLRINVLSKGDNWWDKTKHAGRNLLESAARGYASGIGVGANLNERTGTGMVNTILQQVGPQGVAGRAIRSVFESSRKNSTSPSVRSLSSAKVNMGSGNTSSGESSSTSSGQSTESSSADSGSNASTSNNTSSTVEGSS